MLEMYSVLRFGGPLLKDLEEHHDDNTTGKIVKSTADYKIQLLIWHATDFKMQIMKNFPNSIIYI